MALRAVPALRVAGAFLAVLFDDAFFAGARLAAVFLAVAFLAVASRLFDEPFLAATVLRAAPDFLAVAFLAAPAFFAAVVFSAAAALRTGAFLAVDRVPLDALPATVLAPVARRAFFAAVVAFLAGALAAVVARLAGLSFAVAVRLAGPVLAEEAFLAEAFFVAPAVAFLTVVLAAAACLRGAMDAPLRRAYRPP